MITYVSEETRNNVWNTMLQLEKALVAKDATIIERLLSDDFVGATPTGDAYAKREYINYHCTAGFGIMALSGEDINASSMRFYDNTAVINRRAHSQYKLPTGELLEYDVQRIEVFVQIDNEWKLVSGQGTRVMHLPK